MLRFSSKRSMVITKPSELRKIDTLLDEVDRHTDGFWILASQIEEREFMPVDPQAEQPQTSMRYTIHKRRHLRNEVCLSFGLVAGVAISELRKSLDCLLPKPDWKKISGCVLPISIISAISGAIGYEVWFHHQKAARYFRAVDLEVQLREALNKTENTDQEQTEALTRLHNTLIMNLERLEHDVRLWHRK